MSKINYTHAELVERAKNWLWKQGCSVVITEMASACQEPDAIGWKQGYSILIECKTNRSDFRREKRKSFMEYYINSMGNKRYYLAPNGVIPVEELPKEYGLLVPYRSGLMVTRDGQFIQNNDKNSHDEIKLLISAIRRMRAIPPKGTSVRTYVYETGNRASLGLKKYNKQEGKR